MNAATRYWKELTNGSSLKSDVIDAISKRTFSWHPLGFVVCRLLASEGRAIRVHIWPPDGGRIQEPCWMIHDHLFSFDSLVLNGSILNREYRVDPSGSSYQVYLASYEDGGSVLTRSSSTINLVATTTYEVRTGECYSIQAGVFHESELMGSEVGLTVLYTQESSKSVPLVAGALFGERQYSYVREPVSSTDLEELLNELSQ